MTAEQVVTTTLTRLQHAWHAFTVGAYSDAIGHLDSVETLERDMHVLRDLHHAGSPEETSQLAAAAIVALNDSAVLPCHQQGALPLAGRILALACGPRMMESPPALRVPLRLCSAVFYHVRLWLPMFAPGNDPVPHSASERARYLSNVRACLRSLLVHVDGLATDDAAAEVPTLDLYFLARCLLEVPGVLPSYSTCQALAKQACVQMQHCPDNAPAFVAVLFRLLDMIEGFSDATDRAHVRVSMYLSVPLCAAVQRTQVYSCDVLVAGIVARELLLHQHHVVALRDTDLSTLCDFVVQASQRPAACATPESCALFSSVCLALPRNPYTGSYFARVATAGLPVHLLLCSCLFLRPGKTATRRCVDAITTLGTNANPGTLVAVNLVYRVLAGIEPGLFAEPFCAMGDACVRLLAHENPNTALRACAEWASLANMHALPDAICTRVQNVVLAMLQTPAAVHAVATMLVTPLHWWDERCLKVMLQTCQRPAAPLTDAQRLHMLLLGGTAARSDVLTAFIETYLEKVCAGAANLATCGTEFNLREQLTRYLHTSCHGTNSAYACLTAVVRGLLQTWDAKDRARRLHLRAEAHAHDMTESPPTAAADTMGCLSSPALVPPRLMDSDTCTSPDTPGTSALVFGLARVCIDRDATSGDRWAHVAQCEAAALCVDGARDLLHVSQPLCALQPAHLLGELVRLCVPDDRVSSSVLLDVVRVLSLVCNHTSAPMELRVACMDLVTNLFCDAGACFAEEGGWMNSFTRTGQLCLQLKPAVRFAQRMTHALAVNRLAPAVPTSQAVRAVHLAVTTAAQLLYTRLVLHGCDSVGPEEPARIISSSVTELQFARLLGLDSPLSNWFATSATVTGSPFRASTPVTGRGIKRTRSGVNDDSNNSGSDSGSGSGNGSGSGSDSRSLNSLDTAGLTDLSTSNNVSNAKLSVFRVYGMRLLSAAAVLNMFSSCVVHTRSRVAVSREVIETCAPGLVGDALVFLADIEPTHSPQADALRLAVHLRFAAWVAVHIMPLDGSRAVPMLRTRVLQQLAGCKDTVIIALLLTAAIELALPLSNLSAFVDAVVDTASCTCELLSGTHTGVCTTNCLQHRLLYPVVRAVRIRAHNTSV